MFDVITVGETLVEIMRPGRDQPLDISGEFRGPFASGAPAIYAVAAGRLGLSVGLISGVGGDAFGLLLRRRLAGEGVDISCLQTVPGYSTGMAFVGYTAGGSREFVFHLRHSAAGAIDANDLTSDYFSGVKWLHVSGSALALGEAGRSVCAKALRLALAAGGRLSLDPNLRPELMPLSQARNALTPYLEAAYLLLPTVEEAHALAGTEDDSAAAEVLLSNRERVVVCKRGAKGCTVFTADGRQDVPGFTVEEVDPTGAGDCFNAAFLYGFENGWPLETVARFANAAGALAVTCLGPMEGAPTVQQIDSLIGKEVYKGD